MISAAAGAGTIALLELDAAAVGPFLLSRPFVVGPLIGWARGDAWTGAALGAAFEALTLEELPLGGRLEFSAPVAAGTAAFAAAGSSGLTMGAAFLLGLAAGWAHGRVERVLRRGRGAGARRVEAALSAGESPRLGVEIARGLAGEAAATFVLALIVLIAGAPLAARLWAVLPGVVRAGASAAFFAAPWIGAGSLAASLWRRA